MSNLLSPALPQTKSQQLARWFAARIGWKYEEHMPVPNRCVVVGAHHTSSWDLPAAFLLQGLSGIKFHFVAKKSLFTWPLGSFMRKVGGVSVQRGGRQGFVDKVVSVFNGRESFRLALMPDGTRKKATHWKTSFYYIALKAKVPIVMAYLDYGRKVVGFGPHVQPSGDIQEDIGIFQQFYAKVRGKNPHLHSEIKIKEMEVIP